MAEVILDTQTTPSTPGAGVGKIYIDSTLNLPKSVDSSANAWNFPPTWLISQSADFTGTNDTNAHPIFNAAAAGTITLPGTTSFIMKGRIHIHTTGATSHTFGILFAGTATLTSIGYIADVTNAATEVLGASQRIWISVATVTVLTAATATATHHSLYIDGVVRTNAGGTFIPQYQWGTTAPGAAGVTLANSYFSLTQIGSNTNVILGPWT